MKKNKAVDKLIYKIIEKFKSISYIGRIAYSISCFENILLSLNKNDENCKTILRNLWNFEMNIDEYYYMVVNLKDIDNFIYDYTFFKEQCLPSSVFFDENEFNNIKTFYNTIKNSFESEIIFQFLDMIGNLVSVDMYSAIEGYGIESIHFLSEILIFMKKNNINLPDVTKFYKFSIKENNGWGEKFNGVFLSKIV